MNHERGIEVFGDGLVIRCESSFIAYRDSKNLKLMTDL